MGDRERALVKGREEEIGRMNAPGGRISKRMMMEKGELDNMN